MQKLFGAILAVVAVLCLVIPATSPAMNDGVAMGLALLGAPGSMSAALILLWSER